MGLNASSTGFVISSVGRLGRPGRRLSVCAWAISLLLFFWPACSARNESPGSSAGPAYDAAAISTHARQISAPAGETAEVVLHLLNTGRSNWRSGGEKPCFLSYHLLDTRGRVLKFDAPRTALPGIVEPGGTVDVHVALKAPLDDGDYLAEFDLVREGIAWFKDGGGKTLVLPLTSRAMVWPEDGSLPGLGDAPATVFRAGWPAADRLRRLIRLTLRHDEVAFPGRTGKVEGFAAGAGYPQIWLRDAATIMPASRFYYPESFLTSWIEEHLAFQKADGALEDWVDSRGRTDKNTVETDQETSAVQSAYQVFELKGGRALPWLEKQVAGEPVIDRLERALRYPFAHRFDGEHGLLTGAHTADWGDVDPEDPDQRAIYVDERTHWTADIYDQAMAYEACLELAEMLRAAGRTRAADAWVQTAARLRDNAQRWLWQADKGYYRVHIHLTPWLHDFDEDAMFASGGNAQAVIGGLADRGQAGRIIEEALARQKALGVSTISGSLLPPYPAGFFKHPAMDETYEYQNGGQWDWFGGRLILAMFENGFAREAKDKLLEVIRKDTANEGLFEWDTREGAGRGSDYYGGSAGSLARALFEGYFGFRLGAGGLSLRPRLGTDSAAVHLYLPASGIFAAYDYRPLPLERKIVLLFNSNDPRTGDVRVLVPWELFGLKGAADRARLEVSLDGAEVPFNLSSVRRDDAVVVRTDFKNHRLEIRLAPNRPLARKGS